MAAEGAPAAELADLDLSELESWLAAEDAGACCAALYEHPGVRWVLGEELHPGGAATTRRAFEVIGLSEGDRLLDVACARGESALLAARERGCEVVGVDRGAGAIARAREEAERSGLHARASFEEADAAALPFGNGSFTAVICECSLSAFADKPRAAAEIARVLVPSGRVAISDVVVDPERLPAALQGPLAAIACVGDALDAEGYRRVLGDAGISIGRVESRDADAARLAARVEDRLRGARILGLPRAGEMVELARIARRAIDDGVLGYSIFGGVRA